MVMTKDMPKTTALFFSVLKIWLPISMIGNATVLFSIRSFGNTEKIQLIFFWKGFVNLPRAIAKHGIDSSMPEYTGSLRTINKPNQICSCAT